VPKIEIEKSSAQYKYCAGGLPRSINTAWKCFRKNRKTLRSINTAGEDFSAVLILRSYYFRSVLIPRGSPFTRFYYCWEGLPRSNNTAGEGLPRGINTAQKDICAVLIPHGSNYCAVLVLRGRTSPLYKYCGEVFKNNLKTSAQY